MLTSLKNILTKKNLALMILFILALIVRIIYITQTDYNERSYDIGSIIQLNGHCGYIKFLSEGNFKLPYFNPSERWQYYHTPLHHFISALWIKIVFYFQNYQIAFESLQYLITFYSMLIIFFSYKILKSLNFGFFAIFISLIFIAFHPSMLLFSGILNNDLLCLLLCTISIWRMIEWNKQPTIKNTLILTIFCGLAATFHLGASSWILQDK